MAVTAPPDWVAVAVAGVDVGAAKLIEGGEV
jgi:hypothetical protein